MTFSEKLIYLRKQKHLTQDALAKTVGVSRQAVYMWERGISYPEAQKLIEMRRLFGVSIDSLLLDNLSVVPGEVAASSAVLSGGGLENSRENREKPPVRYSVPSVHEYAAAEPISGGSAADDGIEADIPDAYLPESPSAVDEATAPVVAASGSAVPSAEPVPTPVSDDAKTAEAPVAESATVPDKEPAPAPISPKPAPKMKISDPAEPTKKKTRTGGILELVGVFFRRKR